MRFLLAVAAAALLSLSGVILTRSTEGDFYLSVHQVDDGLVIEELYTGLQLTQFADTRYEAVRWIDDRVVRARLVWIEFGKHPPNF